MGWLRIDGGCGGSSCWEYDLRSVMVGVLNREGVTCNRPIAGLEDLVALLGCWGDRDDDTRRGGDIFLVDRIDDVQLLRLGMVRTGVLLNNCSHIDGVNIPAIGFTLVISCRNPCRVMLSLTSKEDIATCPAASIAATTLYSGDSPVSLDN
jgi:hypothetical protein